MPLRSSSPSRPPDRRAWSRRRWSRRRWSRRAWSRQLHRSGWTRRALTVLALVPVWLLTQLGVALAADGAKLGQTPAALSWIKLVDSRGVSVWNYELSLDRGGVTDPGKAVWSTIIDLFWQIYRGGVVVAIWFIDWALSFAWLPTVVGPVMALSDSLTGIVSRVGGITTLLTIAAIFAVVWMMRGKWALGIFELTISLVIASLATGALASPAALVAGPSGVLMDSRQFGLEVADGLAGGPGTGGNADALRKATTARLVDTFVRLPLQTINFGTVVDGTACQGAYDSVIKAGPYGMEDDIRDAVGGCDEDLGEVAENPSSGQALSAIILSPAALLVMGFATLLAGTVFLAALLALYQGLRAIVTLVTGLLPGSARGALWMTAADLTMALVTLMFAITFLSGYLLLIADAFTARSPDENPMQTFFFVDVLLVAALLLFWKGRKSIQRASSKLAQALATRPGGSATALPQRQPINATNAYYKAKMAAGAAQGVAGAASVLAGPVGALAGVGVSGAARGLRAGGVAARMAWVDLRAAGSWVRWASAGGAGQPDGEAAGGGRTARPHGGPGPALPPSPPRALPPGDDGPDEPQPSGGGTGPRSPGSAPLRLAAALQDRQERQVAAVTGGRLLRAGGQLALPAATGATAAAAAVAAARAGGNAASTGTAGGRRSGLAGALSRGLRAATGATGGPSGSPAPVAPGPHGAAAGSVGAALGGPTGPGRVRTVPRPPASRPRPVSVDPVRVDAVSAAAVGAGKVIDQDGRPVVDAGQRLQARLDARRRRSAGR